MSEPKFAFYEVLDDAFEKAGESLDPLPGFIETVKQVVENQVSSDFYNPSMIARDVRTLYDQANEFRFYRKQFILCVADYVEKSQQMDSKSFQDDNGNTYMKRIQ